MKRRRRRLGIPYAPRKLQPDGTAIVVCPFCKNQIILRERKDFESHSGREYAQHYADKHEA